MEDKDNSRSFLAEQLRNLPVKHLFLVLLLVVLLNSDTFNEVILEDQNNWWSFFIKLIIFIAGYIISFILVNTGCV